MIDHAGHTPSLGVNGDDAALARMLALEASAALRPVTTAADLLLGSNAVSVSEPAYAIADGCRRVGAILRRLASLLSPPGLRPIHLNALITNVVSALRLLDARAVRIATRLEEPLGPVYIDHGELERALLALLMEADDEASLVLSTFAGNLAPSLIGADDRQWVLLAIEGHRAGAALDHLDGAVRRAGGNMCVESTPGQPNIARLWLPKAIPVPAERPVSDDGEGSMSISEPGPNEFDVLSFPPFRLDLANESLWRSDKKLSLRAKPFRILRHLIDHAQRLVTQQELTEAVWGKLVTSESLLRTHVHELRQVLGEGIIETVTGRGYRFVPAVTRSAREGLDRRSRRPRKSD